jgi:3-dehydroquinate dehydratase II
MPSSSLVIQEVDNSSTVRILILNGPNLNLLGQREPEIYGTATLHDIEQGCREYLEGQDVIVDFRQSNHEGQLIDWIQSAGSDFDVLIINAAAFTHTSIALHDALKATPLPAIEIHLSNPHAREKFRHKSYLSPVVKGVISGFGALSYRLAIDAALSFFEKDV